MSPNVFEGPTDAIAGEVRAVLRGKKCWSVVCGGATFPTIIMSLGEKRALIRPLRNPAADETVRKFYGEWNLLIYCAWRLDCEDRVLTGTTDSPEGVQRETAGLLEATVDQVDVSLPGWDLAISFSNGLRLTAFADQLSFDGVIGNWDLWSSTIGLCVKKQSLFTVVHRPSVTVGDDEEEVSGTNGT